MRNLCCFMLFALACPSLFGHGTEYEILSEGVIGIKAAFDTGEVFSHARVLIFEPGESQVTYETMTDRNGVVCFAPDRTGVWILQVRGTEGHGLRINLEVTEDMLAADRNGFGRLSLLQKLVMALAVIWGLAGTALFFLRRR